MGRYVAYYRVSTERQKYSGLGLDAQKQSVSNFVKSNKAQLVAEFTEIESGKKKERIELNKAIAIARHQKAVLLIAKLDRLARNVSFVANILESKVAFKCCDMPEANKVMLQMMAVFAEYEREQISKRTKEALAQKKAQGFKLGNRRNLKEASIKGAEITKQKADDFARDTRLIIDVIEKQIKAPTLQAIADELNRRNIPSRRGGQWYASTVRNIILRN